MLSQASWIWILIAVAGRLLYVGCMGLMLHRENKTHVMAAKFGYEEAFRRFRRFARSLMLLDDLCLFLLPIATAFTITPVNNAVTFILGLILIIIGIGTKIWAAKILGSDGFFFRDTFVPPEERNIVLRRGVRGPYRYLKNPMYGVGNLHIIGWALMWQSAAGLLVAIFSIGALFAFYWLVELPYIKRLKKPTNVGTL